jgi:hypothetical protein
MKTRITGPFITRGLMMFIGGIFCACSARAASSEITPPEKRRAILEAAANLAKPAVAAPLPSSLAVPFNPPGFELSDAEERAAAALASGAKTTTARKIESDLDILEQIVTKNPPTGTMFLGDQAVLTFRNNTVKIGAHFSVNLNGQDYDLELVRLDRTTFTLRLNREEITRPINPAKSP